MEPGKKTILYNPQEYPLVGSLLGTLPGDQQLISPEDELTFKSWPSRFKNLVHVSECSRAICPMVYCTILKREVLHVKLCRVKVIDNCGICKGFRTLLLEHVNCCRVDTCPVWLCINIKFKNEHKEYLRKNKTFNELINVFLWKLRTNHKCPPAELLCRLSETLKSEQQIIGPVQCPSCREAKIDKLVNDEY